MTTQSSNMFYGCLINNQVTFIEMLDDSNVSKETEIFSSNNTVEENMNLLEKNSVIWDIPIDYPRKSIDSTSNLNFEKLDNISLSVKDMNNEKITKFDSMDGLNKYLKEKGLDSNIFKDGYTESYNTLKISSGPLLGYEYTNNSAGQVPFNSLIIKDGLRGVRYSDPDRNEPQPIFDFCGCCDDSVFVLSEKTTEERANGTDNLGMKSIVACESCKYEDLDIHGKELVDWCRDFIIYKEEQYKKYSSDYFDIRLWDFVSDFLGFEKDSGYDYWLLSFLEWNNYSCHGTSIRYDCSIPNDNEDETISDDRYKKIKEWSEKKLTNDIINSVN